MLGTGNSDKGTPLTESNRDPQSITEDAAVEKTEVRRKESASQRAVSGLVSALGGGGGNGPTHAGLPRIPGIPLLPGGIPRNSQGQIDVVNLIGRSKERADAGLG